MSKNALLQITIYQDEYDYYAIIRFVRSKEGGGYDTKSAIAIKYTMFEMNALSFALEEASYNEGSCNYVKYSDPSKGGAEGVKKRVTIAKGYLNIAQGDRYIGVRFTRYEMRALAQELRRICDIVLAQSLKGKKR